MIQDINLPDGCTQSDIDRAMGAMDERLEAKIRAAAVQYARAEKTLLNLKSKAEAFREAFNIMKDHYDDAVRGLKEMVPTADAPMRDALNEALEKLSTEPFADADPAHGATEAFLSMPPFRDIEADIEQDWSDDHGE